MNSSGVFFFFSPRWWYGVGYCQVFFWLVWSSRGKLDDPDPQASLGDRFWRSPGHVMQSYHICNPFSLFFFFPSLSTFSWFPHLNILFYHPNSTRRLICSLRQVFFLSFFVVSFPPYNSSLLRQKDRERGRQIRRFSSFFSLRGNWAVTVSFFCFVWQSQ